MKIEIYSDGNENRNIFESQWKQKYISYPIKTEIYLKDNENRNIFICQWK